MTTRTHMLTLARNCLLVNVVAIATVYSAQQQTFLTVNTDRIAAHAAQYEKQLARRRFKRRAAVTTSVVAGLATIGVLSHQWLKKENLAQPTNGGSGGPRASDAQASDAQAKLTQQFVEREAERYTFKGIFKNTAVQSIGTGVALGVSGWLIEHASKLWTGTNTAWLQELFPFNDKDLVIHAGARLSRQAQIYEQLAGQELVLLTSLEPTQAVSRAILIKNIQFNHNSTLHMLERLMALTRCSLRGFTDTDNLVAGKLIQIGWQLDNMAESYGTMLGGTVTSGSSITLLRALSVNVQQLAMMIVELCQ